MNSTYILSTIMFMHARCTVSQNTALQVATVKTIDLKNTRQVVKHLKKLIPLAGHINFYSQKI